MKNTIQSGFCIKLLACLTPKKQNPEMFEVHFGAGRKIVSLENAKPACMDTLKEITQIFVIPPCAGMTKKIKRFKQKMPKTLMVEPSLRAS